MLRGRYGLKWMIVAWVALVALLGLSIWGVYMLANLR